MLGSKDEDAPQEIVKRALEAAERARGQEAAHPSEERYRALFDSIDAGFCLIEMIYDAADEVRDYRFLEVNRVFERRTGLENVVGRLGSELTPGTEPYWIHDYDRVARTGEPLRVENYHEPTGRWYLAYASRAGGADSRQVAIVFDDITERRRAEEVSRGSEERQTFLLRLSDTLRPLSDPVAIQFEAVRVLGEYLSASRVGYAEDLGDGERVAVTRNYTDGVPGIEGVYHYEDYGPDLIARMRQGQTVVRPDIARDPSLTDAEKEAHAVLQLGATVNVPLVKGGQLVAILFLHYREARAWTGEEVRLLQEVAERTWAAVERTRAEDTLRQSEERFRLLVEGARDYAMCLLDTAGQITFWSAGAERLFGWSEAEALGQDFSLIFTAEDRNADMPTQEIERARSAGRALDRRWHLRKDGVRFWMDGILMRLEDDSGNPRGFAKVARDATAQKRAEEATEAALKAVAQANEELEQRVMERTAELSEMSQMRQELLRKLVIAQEEERGRIARDLHDDTGQQMTVLLLGINRLRSLPGVTAAPGTQELLDQLYTLAGEVAQKSHRLSFTLRPTELDDIGLVGALRNYAEAWSRWSSLPVHMESIGLEESGGVRLLAEIETTIYRVAQEALTNILRHASGTDGRQSATRVSVVVQRRATGVLVTIEDDGPGFDVEATLSQPPGQRRLGIFGMQERARLAGGTLTVESEPGSGTTLYLRLPSTGRPTGNDPTLSEPA